ncbi:hypothetical protein MKW92_049959 [Papaver armeniacum]|nr:hypothetical protein MKW92_049959 [Papaver armeniacum]
MDVNRIGDREREGRRYCCISRGGYNPWGEDHCGDEGGIPVAKMKVAEKALEKRKPSFELSGKLAEETNHVKEPDVRWRLYVLEDGEVLKYPLYIHRKSCYLFGRERRIADIPTKHPSCSKQHAQPDGILKKKISPYIMGLGSTNGTFINNDHAASSPNATMS